MHLNRRLSIILQNAESKRVPMLLILLFGLPLYYIIWTFVFPQNYENFTLRFFLLIISIPWLFYPYLKKNFANYLPAFFIFSITMYLPVFFSFLFIKSNYSDIHAISYTCQIYFLAILISDYKFFLGTTGVGILISVCLILLSSDPDLNLSEFPIEYLPLFLFAYVTAAMLNHKSVLYQESQLNQMSALSGAIAHELRNPLAAIIVAAKVAKGELQKFDIEENDEHVMISKESFIKGGKMMDVISQSSFQANTVINIILDDFRSNKIDKSRYENISVAATTNAAVLEYTFAYTDDKSFIEIDSTHDFTFIGVDALFKFVLYNLLKNSLHYIRTEKDGKIKIWFERGGDFNKLHFMDNGPGIKESKRKKIFKGYMTDGKIDGTGLGLFFCKRVMRSFGGDIYCESEVGKYTDMILLFPKVPRMTSKPSTPHPLSFKS